MRYNVSRFGSGFALVTSFALACTGATTTDEGAGGQAGQDHASSAGAGGAAGGSDGKGTGGKGGSGGKGGASKGGASGSGGPMAGKGGTGGGAMGGTAGTSSAGGTGGTMMGGNQPGCTPDLTGIARDFKSAHPDFYFPTRGTMRATQPGTGLVKDELGPDGKPVYALEGPYVDDAGLQQIAGPDSFNQWFRDVDGVNMAIKHKETLVQRSAVLSSFGSEEFFPLDGKGFGQEPVMDALGNVVELSHNYLLTFELHATIRYESGKNQIVIIESDDDSWVFINGKLAIDHGGLHAFAPVSGNLDMLATKLGLQSGKEYPIAIFFADRNPSGSKLRLSTNVPFTNCDPIFK